MPDSPTAACEYSARYVMVLDTYDLTVTAADATALRSTLTSCMATALTAGDSETAMSNARGGDLCPKRVYFAERDGRGASGAAEARSQA
jgi:hypothetical protein